MRISGNAKLPERAHIVGEVQWADNNGDWVDPCDAIGLWAELNPEQRFHLRELIAGEAKFQKTVSTVYVLEHETPDGYSGKLLVCLPELQWPTSSLLYDGWVEYVPEEFLAALWQMALDSGLAPHVVTHPTPRESAWRAGRSARRAESEKEDRQNENQRDASGKHSQWRTDSLRRENELSALRTSLLKEFMLTGRQDAPSVVRHMAALATWVAAEESR